MKSGRIVEAGRPSEVYASPRNLFTANFVGETNLLEGKVLETDSSQCTVDIKGHRIRVSGFGKKVGQRVIVSIRPEFIPLTIPTVVGWKGLIKQVTFLGNLNRYVVEVEGGIELIAEVSTAEYSTGFRVGESVMASPDDVHMLLFDYPAEGLEKEISLE
jgi:ABC-type Fe3+/spermidine/putrescine transport system ATPase subunit